ncbi:hypothetical protein C8D97_104227 [Pleionea mediterranea]|uniref:Uncharacterized protein n=1 Tax=Pleionea mediterranea TaxID=523701 RepID=A0A316FWT1_9GAMM|nr:hypothetical protein C8D97_104227 [Pleionea mediterranea]
MNNIYLKSVFVNPFLLLLTVMYWHHSSEKSMWLLMVQIFILLMFHLFDFKVSYQKDEDYRVDKNIAFFKVLNFVILGRFQNKISFIKKSVIAEIFQVVGVSLVVFLCLFYNVSLNITVLSCLLAPFLFFILMFKTKFITFYSEI